MNHTDPVRRPGRVARAPAIAGVCILPIRVASDASGVVFMAGSLGIHTNLGRFSTKWTPI